MLLDRAMALSGSLQLVYGIGARQQRDTPLPLPNVYAGEMAEQAPACEERGIVVHKEDLAQVPERARFIAEKNSIFPHDRPIL
jgi:hypothetical protein